jgi:hypothetical protein
LHPFHLLMQEIIFLRGSITGSNLNDEVQHSHNGYLSNPGNLNHLAHFATDARSVPISKVLAYRMDYGMRLNFL